MEEVIEIIYKKQTMRFSKKEFKELKKEFKELMVNWDDEKDQNLLLNTLLFNK